MSDIQLTFPDGAIKSFATSTTMYEVAKSISTSLAKKAIAAKLDDQIIDLYQPLTSSGAIEIITKDDQQLAQIAMWHTTGFVMAATLHKLYPNMQFGEVNVIDDGFFYDTDNQAGQVAVTDLPEIKQQMTKMIKQGQTIERLIMTKQEAKTYFANQSYKLTLLDEISSDQIVVYKLDDYADFSLAPMFEKTSDVKYFELLSVAGAYWQGKSSNPMLQRIYGTAYSKQADLEADLLRRKEAKERDHRVIGNQLDLFFVDPKVGAGLPYWLPNGATIRRAIERYIIDKEVENGYEHVYTPILANLDLYKQSGHWDHYREDMFPPMDMGDGELLELRPMNCPSHIQVFKHHPRSYRELPIRLAELGMMHRYEKSGALSGLQRVREMTLNDGHTFVTPDQIQDEFKAILHLMIEVYNDFNIQDFKFRLSYRDPENTEKYYADDEMWNKAQTMLKGAMDDLGLEYVEAEGEAAFYGPKLDVQTKTAMGNEETLSTIQLDFMLPERFELEYVGEDGQKHRPVMIHRGLVSTMERFTAYLIEIYKGAFPTWLAPTQVVMIPVKNELHYDYCKTVKMQLAKLGLRVEIDDRNEKMGYKIREAQTSKIPYTLVVGDQELSDQTVTVRRYGQEQTQSQTAADFINFINEDVKSYSR